MVRTQIQITEEQAVALKRMATRSKTSMAGIIRTGIDEYLRNHSSVTDQDRVARAKSIVGKFHSGLGDLSERHDDYLAEAYRS